MGDPVFKNSTLGPIETPPFYAVEIITSDLGTFHGFRTDAFARLMGRGETPIEGLYAVGNDASSLFGGAYRGAGAMLGPGMTFGYIAGLHLSSRK